MQETERQLIEAIQAGEREALRRLYERYSRYAMGVGLRMVPEREDMLDIVQDAFVSILSSISTFEYRGEGSLKAWVARIVTNRALSWLKQKQRLQLSDQLPDDLTEEEVYAPIEEVPPDIVNEMINRLPKATRIIVNLHVFGQMSHKEIAQQLGIDHKTSMSQYSRATRQLAKMMKEYLNSQRI